MIKTNYTPKWLQCFMVPLIIIGLSGLCQQAHAVRLKEISSVQGVRDNQLIGYGLVIGLSATGDGRNSPFTSQALTNMLDNLDIHINRDELKIKNIAGVMVTATLPPFIKNGQTIDITVSTLGDASSLQGGTLIATPLKALDGEIYAMAQGSVSIGGFTPRGGTSTAVQNNHLTVGRIPAGAIIEKEVPLTFAGKDEIIFNLNQPDFTTVNRAVSAINSILQGQFAMARDGATIQITIPPAFKNKEIALLAQLENTEVTPDTRARIIIDERTGTVVMGENVQINQLAIAHGNLSVQVTGDNKEPSLLETNANITARDQENRLVQLEPGTTMGELVRALNKVGVTPQDLIAILQSIKAAGGVQAQLEII